MPISDLYSLVSRELRRGATYDSEIPDYVEMAVQTLEGLHNWRHMWRESFQQTLTAGDSQITFAGRLKSVRYVRFAVPLASTLPLAGRFAYAKKSQPESVTSGLTFGSLNGVRFWLTTPQKLQFSGAFAEDVLYDIGWYQFSALDDSLPWLDLHMGVVAAQTIIEMAERLKDDKLIARAEAKLSRSLASISEFDLTHQYDSDDSEMTPFFDDIQEDLFALNDGGIS